MTIAKLKDQLASRLRRQNPDGPDPRDAAIERLERALADEREHTAALRATIDALHFKAEVLETGYAKQLEDARERRETAEQELAELKLRLADFEGTGKDAAQLLHETRVELARVTAERDRLGRSAAASGRPVAAVSGRAPADPLSQPDENSINQLLEDAIWVDEQERVSQARSRTAPEMPTEPDLTAEELISPELVFAKKTDDD
jgi:chromosome segregation ATPase